MSYQKVLRAGVIGCGQLGQLHAEAITRSRHARLVAVCDLDEKRTARLAESEFTTAYRFFKDMFAATELDVVTVATPDDRHMKPVLAAIAHGAHVFCEKPLAKSLEEALQLANAAQRRGVHLAVDYNRRYGYGYERAKSMIFALGKNPIRQAVLHVIDGIPLRVAGKPYALLTSLVSHHLDLLRWLGGEIVSVMGSLKGQVPECPHEATILLRSVTGMEASVSACWRAGQLRTFEHLRFVTDTMVFSVEDVQNQVSMWHENPDTVQHGQPSSFDRGNRFYDTVIEHMERFLEAIYWGRPPPVTAWDGIRTFQVIEAAIESHRTGRWIDVPPPLEPTENTA